MAEIEELKAQIAVLTAALAQRDEALREALNAFIALSVTCEWMFRPVDVNGPKKGFDLEMRAFAQAMAAKEKVTAALSAAPRDETCAHEFETLRDPNTPDGPGDIHIVCKHCGAERNED